ncbi:hypothetical protein D917_10140, partial [Trichinella nativa]
MQFTSEIVQFLCITFYKKIHNIPLIPL